MTTRTTRPRQCPKTPSTPRPQILACARYGRHSPAHVRSPIRGFGTGGRLLGHLRTRMPRHDPNLLTRLRSQGPVGVLSRGWAAPYGRGHGLGQRRGPGWRAGVHGGKPPICSLRGGRRPPNSTRTVDPSPFGLLLATLRVSRVTGEFWMGPGIVEPRLARRLESCRRGSPPNGVAAGDQHVQGIGLFSFSGRAGSWGSVTVVYSLARRGGRR